MNIFKFFGKTISIATIRKKDRDELIDELREMPSCYDDGITENENDSDIDFIRGQIHAKEHFKRLIKDHYNK